MTITATQTVVQAPAHASTATARDTTDLAFGLAMAVARTAGTDNWSPDETADLLQALGLDHLPVVRRSLARNGFTPNAEPLADAFTAPVNASIGFNR